MHCRAQECSIAETLKTQEASICHNWDCVQSGDSLAWIPALVSWSGESQEGIESTGPVGTRGGRHRSCGLITDIPRAPQGHPSGLLT